MIPLEWGASDNDTSPHAVTTILGAIGTSFSLIRGVNSLNLSNKDLTSLQAKLALKAKDDGEK